MTDQILTDAQEKLKRLDQDLTELDLITALAFGSHGDIRRQRGRQAGAEQPIVIGSYPEFYIGFIEFYGRRYNVFRNSLQPGLFVTPPLANQAVWFADEGQAVRWIEEDALNRDMIKQGEG